MSKPSEEQKRAIWAELRARREAAEARSPEERAFLRTPAGQARAARQRGDAVFQCSIDVMDQTAVIRMMEVGETEQTTTDPVAVLNSVCREGWELITGSFVFVERGQQSRDRFLLSGQNVATDGTTVGYYLFRRAEDARTLRS